MPDFDSDPEDTGIQEDEPAIDLSLDDDDTAAKDDSGDILEFDDLDSDIDLNLEDEKSPGDETTAAIEIAGDEEDLSMDLESLDLDLDETDEDKSS